MIKLTCAFALAFAINLNAFAQTPLQASDLNPVAGDGFRVFVSNQFAEENLSISGATAVWNYANLNSALGSDSCRFVVATEIAEHTQVPGANLAFYNLPYDAFSSAVTFLKADAAALSLAGDRMEDQDIVFTGNYETPKILWNYPVSFNASYTSSFFKRVPLLDDLNQFIYGSFTYTVDGFGTLQLPSGSYDNVYRIKSVGSYIDSSEVIPEQFELTGYSESVYHYVRAMTHFPLLSYYETTLTSSNGLPVPPVSFKRLTYLSPGSIVPLSIDKTRETDFVLYPQPAKEQVFVQFTSSRQAGFQVLDITGREWINGQIQNESQIEINVANMPAGIYFLRVNATHGSSVKKFVKH